MGVLLFSPLALSACGAGQVTQTATQNRDKVGPMAQVGDISLRAVELAAPPGDKYEQGSDAELTLAIVNGGEEPDTLVGVSGTDFAGAQISASSGSPSPPAPAAPSGPPPATPPGTAAPPRTAAPPPPGAPPPPPGPPPPPPRPPPPPAGPRRPPAGPPPRARSGPRHAGPGRGFAARDPAAVDGLRRVRRPHDHADGTRPVAHHGPVPPGHLHLPEGRCRDHGDHRRQPHLRQHADRDFQLRREEPRRVGGRRSHRSRRPPADRLLLCCGRRPPQNCRPRRLASVSCLPPV